MRYSIVLMAFAAVLLAVTLLCSCTGFHTIKPTVYYAQDKAAPITGVVNKSSNDTYVPGPDNNPICSDSDYGKTYDLQGRCKDQNSYQTGIQDYCISSSRLLEFYCSNDLKRGCLSEEKLCDYGCSEGACIRKVSESPPQ